MVAVLRALGLGLVMVGALAACSSASSSPTRVQESPLPAAPSVAPASVALPAPTPAPATPAPTPAPTAATCASPCSVLLWERAYSPSVLTVKAGSEVRWTNHSCPGCTVTFTSLGVDSGATAVGDTFTHTFNKPGQYVFHCELDPEEMVGIVTVIK